MIIFWKRKNSSQSGSGFLSNVWNWITHTPVVGVRIFCTRIKTSSVMGIKAFISQPQTIDVKTANMMGIDPVVSEPLSTDLSTGTPSKIALWVGDPELLQGGNPNE